MEKRRCTDHEPSQHLRWRKVGIRMRAAYIRGANAPLARHTTKPQQASEANTQSTAFQLHSMSALFGVQEAVRFRGEGARQPPRSGV